MADNEQLKPNDFPVHTEKKKIVKIDGEDIAEKVEAGAAPFDRQRRAEQAAAGRGADDVERKLPCLVDRRRPRRDDLARELLDRLLEGEMLGA